VLFHTKLAAAVMMLLTMIILLFSDCHVASVESPHTQDADTTMPLAAQPMQLTLVIMPDIRV
jgi:hypothetical protein